MIDSPFRLLLVVFLIAINGFFAAAEVSLLSVRHSRLRQMADEGHIGALAALQLLSNPGRLLSVTQVGVTLASLGLGWAGEDTLYHVLASMIGASVTGTLAQVLHGVCFAASFLIISYCHVVMGEVVPKNLALATSDRLAALVAPALQVFYRISLPFVVVIESSAAAITHALKVNAHGKSGGHSAEELKLIVTSSRGMGYLPEAQEDIIHRVLEMGEVAVREVMVPRNDIVAIPKTASLDDVLRTMAKEKHSRLPVYEDTLEKMVGILHYKDLLPLWEERRRANRTGRPIRPFRMQRILRRHLIAPETKPLSQMLDEFRQGHSHMAMVVDEYGTIVGLLTVEDVLEQLVGHIEDEHDEKEETRPTDHAALELDGATKIRDLETDYGIDISSDAGFETLAGFLLFRLGEIPRAGQSVVHDGRKFSVMEMDRNRIAKVRIERDLTT